MAAKKKKHSNWKRVKKYTRKPTVKPHERRVSGIAGAKKTIRHHYKTSLQNALYSREMATTKTARRKASKKVASIKSQIRKFS